MGAGSAVDDPRQRSARESRTCRALVGLT
jgi:hypothetical protein